MCVSILSPCGCGYAVVMFNFFTANLIRIQRLYCYMAYDCFAAPASSPNIIGFTYDYFEIWNTVM